MTKPPRKPVRGDTLKIFNSLSSTQQISLSELRAKHPSIKAIPDTICEIQRKGWRIAKNHIGNREVVYTLIIDDGGRDE